MPRKGADILVEALERLSSSIIRNILPRHEQGGVFAAEGYACSSALPGVCITSSSPGATNLVTGLTNAMRDSVPLGCSHYGSSPTKNDWH
ncbi:Thiamine pyrophosphate enzyme, N-terminal TPP-binding domain [Sesbania bispinosa]|nr:Thiamine pyrophosphate enzyme, N-terminal TPP-binding domain [Sesbania bispinosa]